MTKYNPVNVDTSYGKGAFQKKFFEEGKLLVRTHFDTLQGEGPFAGRPAFFIRFGGCNFGGKGTKAGPGCTFCDTDFSINKSLLYAPLDLLEIVQSGTKSKLVILTGGEPLLQPDIPMENLFRALKAEGYEIQLETNGTYMPEWLVRMSGSRVTIVVSPKAAEKLKKYDSAKKPVPKIADRMKTFGDVFKFLISADPESPYYDIPAWGKDLAYKINPMERVWLSPIAVYHSAPTSEVVSGWSGEHIDREATARNYARTAELCMEYGARLTIQQHLFTAIP